MYIVNREEKTIEAVLSKTFSELQLTERYDLQEWLKKKPNVLAKDEDDRLLIIQEEFSDFDETNERLDLLAIDREANLVIIENKRDDSGRDVTWQALKYASYCSNFTEKDIVEVYQKYLGSSASAESNLKEFFQKKDLSGIEWNKSQRIILVAASFRKEVTATVLWLRRMHDLKIQCIKIVPYQLNEQLLLDIEQIIPLKETEEYMIGLARKEREEANKKETHKETYRREFWEKLLEEARKEGLKVFQGINRPGKDFWISTSAGVSGVAYQFNISGSSAKSLIGIIRTSQEENKKIFKLLEAEKQSIESKFGAELEWQESPDTKYSAIVYKKTIDADYLNAENWDGMISFMINGMIRLEKAFKEPIENLKKQLN